MNTHHGQIQGTAKVYPGNLLQVVTDYRFHTGAYLGGAQHHQWLLDESAKAYLLKQAGVTPRRGLPIVATVRTFVGTALIWTGQRPQGAATVEPAAG